MTLVSFTVPGTPIAQPRPRVVLRGRFANAYVPKDHPVHAYRTMISIEARCRYSGPLIEGPIAVGLLLAFQAPQAQRERTGWKTTRPDSENVAKAILDSLTGILWKDDSQVCALNVEKVFDDNPRTEIMVRSL